jgi:tRNA-dihydrouridine synthase A
MVLARTQAQNDQDAVSAPSEPLCQAHLLTWDRIFRVNTRPLDRRLAVAPMLDWTDRFFRYLVRLISRRTLLYTEMVTTGALIHGDRERFLAFDPAEHPVALQLGGSDPAELARCARMGKDWGYDEINLNLGCPSERVQSGRFGACLMDEPALVAEGISAMVEAVEIPVTAKTRIGIEERDSYGELADFVATLAEAGCKTFIIHARKAWLQGLSPKENRAIPPLEYDRVYRLKTDFPHLTVVLNGGVTSLAQVREHLTRVDGVMIGRQAYHTPWILAEADGLVFGDTYAVPDRHHLIAQYLPFVQRELARGAPLGHITRHLVGIFHGMPGARAWRRHLSENAHRKRAGIEVIQEALAKLPRQRKIRLSANS